MTRYRLLLRARYVVLPSIPHVSMCGLRAYESVSLGITLTSVGTIVIVNMSD